jgi:hypothetical protein
MAIAPSPRLQVNSDETARTGTRHIPARLAQVAFFLLGSLLRDALRETDCVAYAAERHMYAVLLPECGEPAAWQAAQRLGSVLNARTGVLVRAGVAEFPRDGLIVEDLFDSACSQLRDLPLQTNQPSTPREAANA